MIYADYQRNTQQLKSYIECQWSFVWRMAGTFLEMITLDVGVWYDDASVVISAYGVNAETAYKILSSVQ